MGIRSADYDRIYFYGDGAGIALIVNSITCALTRAEAEELLNCLRRLLERTEPKPASAARLKP